MLRRVFSDKFLQENPSYEGCTVSQEWKKFSTFKAWMEQRVWEGLELDKDILVKGNKEYGPNTCCFVPKYINSLLLDVAKSRGDYPIGVTRHLAKRSLQPFTAQIQTGDGGKILKKFYTISDAHVFWQENKILVINKAIERYTGRSCCDPMVVKALESRVIQLRQDIENNRETIKL
jgi:hypothetical protein